MNHQQLQNRNFRPGPAALSRQQAAEMLGVDQAKIVGLIGAGLLQTTKGGHVLLEGVQKLIADREAVGVSATPEAS